jgi:hypothetical protein
MKTYYLIPVILLLAYTAKVQGQNGLANRITLRKSFKSSNARAEAAAFTFNKPKESPASWAADAAIGIQLFNALFKRSPLIMTLNPYIEYHKNTLVDKEQDSREAGIATQWQTNALPLRGPGFSPIFILSEKYNEDRVKGNYSMRGNLYFTPLFPRKDSGFLSFITPNNIALGIDSLFDFQYAPYIGLEHENRTNTGKVEAKGHIYRWYARINPVISFFPTRPNLRGRIEVSADYQYRWDFSKNVQEIGRDTHEYFTIGFSYAFFKNGDGSKAAKIGFDFVNGEDPTANFEEQSYYAITLKVKL